jgi:hypothetical protein
VTDTIEFLGKGRRGSYKGRAQIEAQVFGREIDHFLISL